MTPQVFVSIIDAESFVDIEVKVQQVVVDLLPVSTKRELALVKAVPLRSVVVCEKLC